jgi:hypothetical protein
VRQPERQLLQDHLAIAANSTARLVNVPRPYHDRSETGWFVVERESFESGKS